MSEINDGGSAFPRLRSGHVQEARGSGDENMSFTTVGGMSLRDYFAAQALANLVRGDAFRTSLPQLAQYAYELADAMLTERAK